MSTIKVDQVNVYTPNTNGVNFANGLFTGSTTVKPNQIAATDFLGNADISIGFAYPTSANSMTSKYYVDQRISSLLFVAGLSGVDKTYVDNQDTAGVNSTNTKLLDYVKLVSPAAGQTISGLGITFSGGPYTFAPSNSTPLTVQGTNPSLLLEETDFAGSSGSFFMDSGTIKLVIGLPTPGNVNGLSISSNGSVGIGTANITTANTTTANTTTANVDTLNINPAGTGIVLPASGKAQQIEFAGGGSPTLPNSLQFPSVAALPYSIYREGGSWNDQGSDPTYPDLVISYHTGIKLIAYNSYGGTRFYSDYRAGRQTDANILLSVGNGDNHVRVGSPTNTTSDLIVYGKVTAPTANITTLNMNGAPSGNPGDITFGGTKQGLVGVYDATKTQAIWAMGAAFTLGTDTSSTNYGRPSPYGHYGLAWSYIPDYDVAGNNPQSKAGLSHQLLIQHNGQTKTAIGTGIWTFGNVTAATAPTVGEHLCNKTYVDSYPKLLAQGDYAFNTAHSVTCEANRPVQITINSSTQQGGNTTITLTYCWGRSATAISTYDNNRAIVNYACNYQVIASPTITAFIPATSGTVINFQVKSTQLTPTSASSNVWVSILQF